MTEIVAMINEESEQVDNTFFDPLPNDLHNYDTSEEMDDSSTLFTQSVGRIKCRFGRFGETYAVYVNSTAVKCVTPAIGEDPYSLPSQEIKFSISMNGYDFEESDSDLSFTFEGYGSSLGLGPVILTILLLGFVLAGFIYFM
jgi:hypothetical protein